ncbi:DsbA family oxidoreductase [Halobaculum sp. D14]|uniref:DsbA family oxidoreductase n=1 Tax=Halobaculum sp. D14 TaxID=3421642 RepID=UPI003EC0D6A3
MQTEIHVYGDPLDPRGWVTEPALRALDAALGDADWRFHPTVLVPDWAAYDGPEFPGGKGSVAAVCSRVSEESGMPIDEFLWFDDPPATSAPACRGVVAAAEQGAEAERRFLRAAREATFLRRTNLDTESAVVDLAASVPGVDADGFADDVADAAVPDPDASVLDVTGVDAAGDRPALPTVVVRGDEGERGVSGWADFDELAHVVQAATGSAPPSPSLTVAEALDRYSAAGWLAPAELTALTGESYDDAADEARADDDVVERSFASEPFFRAADYVADEEPDATDEPAGDGAEGTPGAEASGQRDAPVE